LKKGEEFGLRDEAVVVAVGGEEVGVAFFEVYSSAYGERHFDMLLNGDGWLACIADDDDLTGRRRVLFKQGWMVSSSQRLSIHSSTSY